MVYKQKRDQTMKTVKEYNKILNSSNHRLFSFPTDVQPVFALVRVSGKGSWLDKLLGLDIVETLFSSADYKKICQETENVIVNHRGLVKAK
jgi:hypothetical protein